MKATKRTKRKIIQTAADLARAVGRDRGTITRWIQREDWPFAKHGPWSAAVLADIVVWAEQALSPNPGAIDPLEVIQPNDRAIERRAKIAILLERGRLLKSQRLEREGALIARDEVENREVRQAQAVKQELMGLKTLAVKMEGMDVQQREVMLENWARACCERFANAKYEPGR